MIYNTKVRFKKTVVTLLFLTGITISCTTDRREFVRRNLRHIDLPEYGITILFPRDWNASFSKGRFYQLIVTGFSPNGSPATIEFRSLTTRLRDPAGKNIFATGWYQSPKDNYPGWKFKSRKRDPTDREGTYEFEGTFKKDGITYRRIGKLRFRKNRVHAIYYTVQDSTFSDEHEYFEIIDSQHKYYRPQKKPGKTSLK